MTISIEPNVSTFAHIKAAITATFTGLKNVVKATFSVGKITVNTTFSVIKNAVTSILGFSKTAVTATLNFTKTVVKSTLCFSQRTATTLWGALVKTKDFTVSQGQRLGATLTGRSNGLLAWLKTHRKTILWVSLISALMLASGIILTYLYFTRPGFRAFVLGIRNTVVKFPRQTDNPVTPPSPASVIFDAATETVVNPNSSPLPTP